MRSGRSSPRGLALFAALITMVLVAVFVAGAWAITLREFRASTAGASALRAAEAAEYAVTAPMERWVPGDALAIPIGSVVAPTTRLMSGGATATWRLQRLSNTTLLSLGEGLDGDARRAATLFLRLVLPDFDSSAALTVRDSAFVRPGALVSGFDVTPPSWAGLACPVGAVAAATMSPDSTHVCDGTCGSTAGMQLIGQPARLADTTAADSALYTIFGGESWTSLASRASVRLGPSALVTPAPVATGGTCDRTVSSNWGDPARASACSDYFPIVWAAGDLTLHGGAGQGILLVEGDVILEAGAQFSGVIVTRDDVRTSAGGAHVYGRVFAQDRDVSDGRHPEIASGGILERSSCAVTRASIGSSPLRRVRERSWNAIFD